MSILTNGVRSSDIPPIFSGRDGTLEPHDEHAGRLTSILSGIRSLYTVEETTRRASESLLGRFGYYCSGTQTPFVDSYWDDAQRAAGCALEGADRLPAGADRVYVACRPPGHHAGPDFFGGYCYLNSTALSAERLSREGRVAVLDIDYHHGNGTQEIFYATDAALTVSIHADTRFAYPHFSGSSDENGTGAGAGHNVNLPVALEVTTKEWMDELGHALERISGWRADALVPAFGADTYKLDPVGALSLEIEDYRRIGERVSSLGIPVLAVQEGGYAIDALGRIVASLLAGLDQP